MNNLQPQSVFKCFAQVNQIPRPSKQEEKMIEFLLDFGKKLGLDTRRDEAGNVIIRKPATPGMEDRKTIVLQSHMDMVCEKNRDIDFDFTKDAIQTYVDGEWMKAKGTTLGADDGIGVAMEMALLEANDIEHGPLECVFTRDEETGLTGAEGMQSDFMTGRLLVNLDSEDEGQIFVSCGPAVTAATTSTRSVRTPTNSWLDSSTSASRSTTSDSSTYRLADFITPFLARLGAFVPFQRRTKRASPSIGTSIKPMSKRSIASRKRR